MKKIQQYLDVVSRSLGPNYFLLLMEDLHLHIDRSREFLYLTNTNVSSDYFNGALLRGKVFSLKHLLNTKPMLILYLDG